MNELIPVITYSLWTFVIFKLTLRIYYYNIYYI